MKMEGKEIGETLCRTDTSPSEGLYFWWNVSLKVSDFMRIPEEKFSCINRDKSEEG
jgi:hypothetical protein